VVTNGEVKIVDEFTGRIMEGRRYSEGLHQAIEAKEGVLVREENQTLATITLQNYFRLYDKLSGMTGTAITEDAEFREIYNLPVQVIPTNRPVQRVDHDDLVYRTIDAKFNAVADEIEHRHAAGQPVLVGTVSIESSERLSRLLNKRGIKHEVLNAKFHEREAQIVAQAGRLGAVTIATNMAGRGTDILLGGNAEEMTRDELMGYDFGIDAEVLDRVLHEANWRLLGKGETGLDPVERSVFNRVLEGVRALGIDVDTATFAQIARTYEEVMAKTRAVCRAEHDRVVEAGGLTVIGTERHESRRIDNQLRGRAGRQGDPGETQFYLSLEDDLMRMFGGERMDKISNLMVATEMGDDQPIQHKMISKAVEGAQRKVENINFSMRKNVLEYDDVMNKQRQVIYAERNKILDGKDLSDHIDEVIADTIKRCVTEFCPVDSHEGERDLEGLHKWVVELTGRPDAPQFAEASYTELCDAVLAFVEKAYDAKAERLGESLMQELNCQVMLRVIDTRWMGYLQEMDYLKQGIGLRGFGQRDPLVEYKTEAFRAFQMLVDTMYEDYLRTVMHAEFKNPEVARARIEGERNPALAGARMSGPAEVDGDTGSSTIQRQAAQQAATAGAGRAPQGATGNAGATVRTYRKDQSGDPYANVGRNDPCPCGSGKKFKNCHGRNR
ncbi:MAG: SEC-C metal-binding domain-containing protein, partial [Collinsella stercoris]|nr:SEC-C metal-binding domain-containing protein [Collinsella stercoris]